MMPLMPPSPLKTLATRLRKYALSFPEAYEEFPWGERVAKVNKKVFVFLGREPDPETGYSFSVKLPRSGEYALSLPFVEPTGYGLGSSGWVTVTLKSTRALKVAILEAWIEESYRAIAPKKLVAKLPA
jgi:predicted DNA-binding protein (MmcQ/YjbR family)